MVPVTLARRPESPASLSATSSSRNCQTQLNVSLLWRSPRRMFSLMLTFLSMSRKALKCCLSLSMIASPPCSVNRSSSGTISAIERNSDPTSNARNNFVPGLVGAIAVSCLLRFNERSHGFNIFAGFSPSHLGTGCRSRSCKNVDWDCGCCRGHGDVT